MGENTFNVNKLPSVFSLPKSRERVHANNDLAKFNDGDILVDSAQRSIE